jgi:hypothetical protein
MLSKQSVAPTGGIFSPQAVSPPFSQRLPISWVFVFFNQTYGIFPILLADPSFLSNQLRIPFLNCEFPLFQIHRKLLCVMLVLEFCQRRDTFGPIAEGSFGNSSIREGDSEAELNERIRPGEE